MKKTKITYWFTTGIVAVMMAYSALQYFTNPAMKEGFAHMGFPDFFRIELGIAKFLGAAILILPVAGHVKEWAYAGFGIVFISAFLLHVAAGDPVSNAVSPLVFLVLLIVSNITHHNLKAAKTQPEKTPVLKEEEGFEKLVMKR